MAKIPFSKQDVERFWARVDKSGDCWLWTGARGGDRQKYGYFRPSGPRGTKQWSAHRFAYVATFGRIPDGIFVCHYCNEGLCVNPDHLYPGTAFQNTRDAMTDGLIPTGERAAMAKFTNQQASNIRRIYDAGGVTHAALAKRFSVSESTIRRLVVRRTYRDAA